MKKLIKTLALTSIAAVMAISASSCGGKRLNGKYVLANEEDLRKYPYIESLEFDGEDVEMVAHGMEIDYVYTIEDDEIIFEIELNTDGDRLRYNAYDFEKKGDTITLDGVEFVKEK